jgi:predicted dehydrogenase
LDANILYKLQVPYKFVLNFYSYYYKMAPIRVAIIGLTSATGEISASPGDGWAATAHLPNLLLSPHYQVVALCNTSVQSAKTAVQRHKLPASTKTYGSPEDLANDPDIDLVVCCVRVDRHYKVMKPVLEKGIDVFVEWPLGANLQEAEEMAAIAEKSGSKTFVGLQGRMAPEVQKLKELLKDGKIGDVLSSTITADCGGLGGPIEPPGVDYMTKKSVGGNILTILFGHAVDNALYALGELEEFSALWAIRYPRTQLLDTDGSPAGTIDRETPDQVLIQGTIVGSAAPLSIHLRGGKAFKGSPSLVWRIFGTKGEIQITSAATSLGINTGTEKFELYDHEKDEVEIIDCPFPDAVKDVGGFAKCIGLDYDAFATGRTEGLVTFRDAVVRHAFIDEIWKSSETKRQSYLK